MATAKKPLYQRVLSTAGKGAVPVSGVGWCSWKVWPWLTLQAEAWRQGRPLQWPVKGDECLALVGLVVVPAFTFLVYFAGQVWKEVERDRKIYKDTAKRGQRLFATAGELLGRWWDALSGWVAKTFAQRSFTRRYLAEVPHVKSLAELRSLVQMEINHLEIEDIYVELRAAHRRPGHLSANPIPPPPPRDRELIISAPIWDHLRILDPGFALVIIGSPGSGKTTLLKHLMLNYARNQQWRQRVRHRIPLFIELRKLPKWTKAENPTLPSILASVLEADEELGSLLKCKTDPSLSEKLQAWLESVLRQGRCLLLWDGLDEVPDSTTRKKISAWLDGQINHPD